MSREGVLEYGIPIAVKFPQAQKDVVQLGDVVDLELIGSVTLETGGGTVLQYPIGINFRSSDTFFNISNFGVATHAVIIYMGFTF